MRTSTQSGSDYYASLGVPGGAMIDKGLDDLAAGRETIASLAVALAATRLRREGVPVPNVCIEDPDCRLYRLIERESDILAHERYNAYRRQIVSFAHALFTCRSITPTARPSSH